MLDLLIVAYAQFVIKVNVQHSLYCTTVTPLRPNIPGTHFFQGLS